MAILLLLLCVFFRGISSSKIQHHIAPVAACNLNQNVDILSRLDECHNRCNTYHKKNGVSAVQLYHDHASDILHTTVSCHGVKITQDFTETWTFSQIASPPVITFSKPNRADCDEFIRTNCSSFNCFSRAPSELQPEYFYASTNKKVGHFLSVSTHHSTIIEKGGVLKISPMGSTREFNLSLGVGEDETGIHYWNSNQLMERCPLSPGAIIPCDNMKTDTEEYLSCGEGRVIIRLQGQVALTGKCEGLTATEEGLIYKIVPRSATEDAYNTHRLSVESLTAFTAEDERLRILTEAAIFHLDADICSLQCEVAGLEVRVSRRNMTLTRSGDEYILMAPKGHGYRCKELIHCRLNKPVQLCGSPASVSIKCDSKDYYWDPSKNFVQAGSFCHAVRPVSKLMIHMGDSLYEVNEGLYINISDDDPYTHKSRGAALSHPGVIVQEDLSDIRNALISESALERSTVMISETKTIDSHSLGLKGLISWFASLFVGVFRVFSHLELAVIIILTTALACYIGGKLWSRAYSGHRRVPRNEQESETVWL